jgi:uncharacterized protein YbjT (DUF2867 family)
VKLTVFGSTGRTGRHVLEQALARTAVNIAGPVRKGTP